MWDDRDWEQVQIRLGYLTVFPFYQPELAKFSLDLSVHDQRMAACLCMQLMSRERAILARPQLRLPDGTDFKFDMGIPASWEKVECLPQGRFSFTYTCAPETRRFQLRHERAQQYGCRSSHVGPEQVLWWSG